MAIEEGPKSAKSKRGAPSPRKHATHESLGDLFNSPAAAERSPPRPAPDRANSAEKTSAAASAGNGHATSKPAPQSESSIAGAAPSRKWTPAQLQGITTVGTSLLVSAAAGSGKTAMLAERCAYLVCDAPEPHRCDVDELLVVTFTEAAAAEMKSRIGQALRARVARGSGEGSGGGDRLRRQLALVEQAQVSTLHSFCSRLLRQHFHLVGLDPGFSVMDGEEAKLLRAEVGRDLMQQHYEIDSTGDFHRLVDAYAEGDDERLLRHLLRTHEMLASLVDPAGWLGRTRSRLAQAAEAPLEASELGGELIDLVGHRLHALRERCASALRLLISLGGFPGYLAQLQDLARALEHWEQLLGDARYGLGALAESMEALELPRLPPIKNDVPNKELAKAAIDSVRNGVKSGPWRDCLRFTADQWQDGMRRVLPHAATFLNLVEQFQIRYERAKELSRQVDFSDLERLALRVLRDPAREGLQPTPTARAYHRLFKQVLVDEYQDINELQDSLLMLLSHECLGARENEPPNFFCVGDVKQSIYRFRLAEPERFLQREHLYRGAADGDAPLADRRGRVIDLSANFRSRARLLGAINGVFERLMTRDATEIQYDQSHRLIAGADFPEPGLALTFPGAPIELHLLPKDAGGASAEGEDGEAASEDAELDQTQRESLFVARRIRQLVGLDGGDARLVTERIGGEWISRPIQFRDIVILLRSMRHKADQYADVLRRAGVPVHSESGTGYFESTEVRDLLALLTLLDNQRQDIPLVAVLRSPLGRLPHPEDSLARIRLAFPSRESPVPFHQAAERYAVEQDDALAARLREFFAELSRWRQMAHRRPPAETIAAIYQRTGYLAFVAGLPGGEQRVANLMYLHERAAQFGTFQRQGLGRFIQFLEGLRAEADLGLPSISNSAENVVRIMSVHRSKGLEFPVVVLPDLGKKINLQETAGPILLDRQAGLGMAVVDETLQVRYPSLAQTLVQERLRRLAMAEELRVLYVAMTRAKEHLILVGTCSTESPDRWNGVWSGHRGALPADAIIGAASILDWVGPVAACPPGAEGEILAITSHTPADVAGWTLPTQPDVTDDPRLAALARLEPLDPSPPIDVAAQATIDRFTYAYPFQVFTTQPAVRAVTDAPGVPAPPRRHAAPSLPWPRFMSRDASASAADIGASTHRVLQYLDYSRPCDPADIDAQIAELLARRLIEPADATRADRVGVAWFASTDLGNLLRENAGQLRRELPVYFAAACPEASSADPLDHPMIRGRVDVLLPLLQESIIVDFKTDTLAPESVPARANTYAAQTDQYRLAIERITGKPVLRTCLVFLTARIIYEVGPAADDPASQRG